MRQHKNAFSHVQMNKKWLVSILNYLSQNIVTFMRIAMFALASLSILSSYFSADADTSITELGHWLVALKDIKFDLSSITKLVEFVKR